MRVVVVGSGIAGLTVALHAIAPDVHVTMVTKDVLEHANTRFAQGGIAGVMFADDRVEDHVRDTLVAGAGLSDPEAVRVLVEEGPARIRELVALGVAFDRVPTASTSRAWRRRTRTRASCTPVGMRPVLPSRRPSSRGCARAASR